MSGRLSDPQTVGFALAVLGAVFLLGWLLRRAIPALRALYIPAAVIAGFLVLLLGPQVLGELTGRQGIFPQEVLDVWRVLPGLLINVVFGAIMIGKALPSMRDLWRAAAPHAILGTFLSFGQFALGGLAVLLLLGPVFGLSPEAGSLLEMSFAGGHGTIAGMGQLLTDAGAPEAVDIGLGLATVSMVTGIVVGSALVRYGLRHPEIPVARQAPLRAADDYDIDEVRVAPADEKATDDHGISGTTLAFALISIAILIAVGLLRLLQLVAGDVFDTFPLFPLTVIGGFIVQAIATRTGLAPRIDKRAVAGISSLALDALIVCAIGTMSLATIGSNVPAMIVFTVIGVSWSVVVVLLMGRRVHRDAWFERSMADFGQSQGNVATGFLLADMVDPDRVTTTANDYGYKQLAYEPFLGGGLLTAMSVPAITAWGLGPFTAASVVATVLAGVWGVRRRRG